MVIYYIVELELKATRDSAKKWRGEEGRLRGCTATGTLMGNLESLRKGVEHIINILSVPLLEFLGIYSKVLSKEQTYTKTCI